MSKLARRYGAEPLRPETKPFEARSAYAIAEENAVEGCIRETFGALLGCYQALSASDSVVAEAMKSVAQDEIEHAELSLRVAAFLETLLSPSQQTALAAARRHAIAELRLEMTAGTGEATARIAGLPPNELAQAWLDRLQRDLWIN